MARRGWGEGSVCQRVVRRGDREYIYWRAIVPAGPSGRRREFQARSERVVRAWLRAELGRDRGPAPRATGVTLAVYARDWLLEQERTGSRPSTVEFHRYALLRLEPLDRLPLSAITPQHVRDSIAVMVDKGLASRSIRGSIQTLGQVLQQAEADGLVTRNAARVVKLPRLDQRPARHFTQEQAQRIVAFAKGDPLASLYAVGLGTALRRGELLALTWGDVDLKDASLRVDRSKTKAGIRWIPLSPYVVDTLRSIERSPGPIWPYNKDWVSRDFGDFCRRAGIPVLTLHSLRHTALTLMAEAGVPIEVRRWIAGHSRTEMTAYYSHESRRLMRDAVDSLDRMVG